MIENTISIGVIVQTGIIVGSGLIAFGVIKRSVIQMEKEILGIKEDQKSLAKTVAEIAVQNNRLNRLEEDIRDLRHGRGFIVDPNGMLGKKPT